MSVFWLTPAAWWGLAALSIPILIHLLARQRSRRLLFPSLRFLRITSLAALKQRRLSNWPLLAVRSMAVAAAVCAVAGPVFVSDSRWQSWSTRTARAIVVAPPREVGSGDATQEIAALTRDAQANAFVSAVFEPKESIADGLRDAAIWLARQPPAAREVVLLGDLRVGALTAYDFEPLSAATGIRILPVISPNLVRQARLRSIADAGSGVAEWQDVLLTLADESTTIERRTTLARASGVTVIAAPGDQQRADAAMRAVMAEGIVMPRDSRRLVIEFDGAPTGSIVQPPPEIWMRRALERLPGMTGGARDGQLVIRPGSTAADARVAFVVARIVETALGDDLRDVEPSRISARVLAGWSRPAGAVPRTSVPADEGDRRYFWAGVLVLLLVEQWLRRSRTSGTATTVASTDDREARVA